MTEWREIKFGDVATFSYGKMPLSKNIVDYGYPIFSGYKIVGYYNSYMYEEPQLIIVARGDGIGNVKISPPKSYITNLSIIADLKLDKVDKTFLYYYFKIFSLRELDSGSVQSQITISDLNNYYIFLPPLPEQKAIAKVLSSLDDKIDLLTRQNKTLEDLAQAYFRKWFIEDASDEWEEIPLGQLFVISSGKALKKEKFSEHGLYRVLGANGEIGRTNEYLFNERLIYTGCVGTLGKVFIVDREPVWLSNNTLVFRNIDYFFFVYFTLKYANLADYNVGSTQPFIRQSDIKEIRIFMPDKERLDCFENLANTIFAKINANQKQIQLLQKLRDTLLPKLIRGEIRVKM